jgi:hypothetical protein
VTRHPAHRPRVRVVYLAVDQSALPVHLRGGGAPPERRSGEEARLAHRQRSEDPLLRESVQRLAGDPLQHQPEEHHVPVAVQRTRARRIGEGAFRDRPEVRIAPAQRLEERREGLEPARVREQHADGDAGLRRVAQLRQVGGHRAVQRQPPRLLQHHRDRRRRHHLGERCEVVERAVRHWRCVRRTARLTEPRGEHQAPVPPHGQRHPWRRAGRERRRHDGVQHCPQAGVHPHRRRIGGQQRVGHGESHGHDRGGGRRGRGRGEDPRRGWRGTGGESESRQEGETHKKLSAIGHRPVDIGILGPHPPTPSPACGRGGGEERSDEPGGEGLQRRRPGGD